jgi:hypothetical protein
MCAEGCGIEFEVDGDDAFLWDMEREVVKSEQGARPILLIHDECPHRYAQNGEMLHQRPGYVVFRGYLSAEAIAGDLDHLNWDVGWRLIGDYEAMDMMDVYNARRKID